MLKAKRILRKDTDSGGISYLHYHEIDNWIIFRVYPDFAT